MEVKVVQFSDKRGRTIILKESYDEIYAYCIDGTIRTEVGYIQFHVIETTSKYTSGKTIAYPDQMHIISEYQRSGIATQIIQYAKQIYGTVQFAPDTGCGGNTDEIHYTSEGLQFKNYCEESGITEYSCDQEDEDY